MQMDICRAACLVEPPVPAYPVVAKVVKKNRLPACDAFGPFPDETLMSGIDRVLFLMGARRVQKFLHLPTPSMDGSNNSDCSISVSHVSCPDEHKPCRTCSTVITTDAKSPKKQPSTISVTQTCCCPKCQSATSRTTVFAKKRPCLCGNTSSARSSKSSAMSRVQICEPNSSKCSCRSIPTPKSTNPLKRSFSLCSLACRKLKQMLTFPPKDNKAKWLWTRLQCTPNGCEVYEIFKNSSVCTHPSEFEKNRTPQVIFVVLQNGVIMPFEILTSH